MKTFYTFLLTLAAVSAASIRRELPEGYDLSGELEVIGSYVDGGENVTFKGTAESVIAQIKESYPDFKLDEAEEVEESDVSLSDRGLERRAHATHHYCRAGRVGAYNGGEANRDQIAKEIGYLRSIGSRTCGVNARSCVRVSCSWGAGIWWCNDNNNWYGEKCNDIANLAQIAVYKCERHMKATCWFGNPNCADCGCRPVDEWVVWGQQFSSANHNVIVTSDRC
ncbi:hypothetical protein FALBO_574 [Fusarium albosuccineum]|uniref:Uncharacterized protein n=1 Tax=Fusarium albosuccineum TaxID=1237068 RepID=A0A8H4LQT8_9HYPO|nr:hypothetical protein FALBO_574 [Fusarium albosuccineum]